MLFQGPNMIDWFDWRFRTHPTIDDGDLYDEMKPSLHRFELWLKAAVHVPGGPNWVFVRPFTHGAKLSAGGLRQTSAPRWTRCSRPSSGGTETGRGTDFTT